MLSDHRKQRNLAGSTQQVDIFGEFRLVGAWPTHLQTRRKSTYGSCAQSQSGENSLFWRVEVKRQVPILSKAQDLFPPPNTKTIEREPALLGAQRPGGLADRRLSSV